MNAKIINGKQISQDILSCVFRDVQKLRSNNINPALAVFRAGSDFGSISYEKNIKNVFSQLEIDVRSFVFDENVSEGIFIEEIKRAGNNPSVHGILVLEPMPEGINRETVRASIVPEKDIDGINPVNAGKLLETEKDCFAPCAAEAVMLLLKHENIDVREKNITIINNSTLFGKPLSILLTNEFATVSICNRFTKSLKQYTMQSDIVITACGVCGIIRPDMLRNESMIIDIAIALSEDGLGRRCGDCSESCAEADVKIISATKGLGGGTGPITTAVLAKHVAQAALRQNRI